LHWQIIDAKRFTKSGIRNGLIKRETTGKERDEEVTNGPILDLLVEYNLVSEDYHIELACGEEAVQDIPTRLAARL
jgi:hypothetical protein